MEAPKNKGSKSGRPIYKVDSPYTSVKWPTLEPTEHDVIVDMLVRLFTPIGHHRTLHTTPSKGKRSRKRKRTEQRQPTQPPPPPPPPVPEIANHITIGINSTTRHLENLSSSTVPPSLTSKPDNSNAAKQPGSSDKETTAPTPITAVFIPASPNSLIHAHLPVLCATASSATTPLSPPTAATATTASPTPDPILLVPLKPSVEAKLAAALGIPRLGVIGLLQSAPGADALVEYVRGRVEAVDVPWLREVREGRYLGVNVLVEEGGRRKR